MKTTTLAYLGLLLGSVAGQLTDYLYKVEHPTALVGRQYPPASSECASTCRVSTTAIATCSDTPCLCSNTVGKGLADCFNCEMMAGHENIQYWSAFLQSYVDSCARDGFALDRQVLQGQGTTSTIWPYTASPLPSATSSASQPWPGRGRGTGRFDETRMSDFKKKAILSTVCGVVLINYFFTTS